MRANTRRSRRVPMSPWVFDCPALSTTTEFNSQSLAAARRLYSMPGNSGGEAIELTKLASAV
jgi:hypothetical protein